MGSEHILNFFCPWCKTLLRSESFGYSPDGSMYPPDPINTSKKDEEWWIDVELDTVRLMQETAICKCGWKDILENADLGKES